MTKVFLLWHGYPKDSEDPELKLLGVFSSLEAAQAAQAEAINQPGFRDWPDCFEISEKAVDQSEWTEGFVTIPRE